ncbi:MAG: circularly permuted type 2 ATP-grasp protein, partial [Corynebacterium variabile]
MTDSPAPYPVREGTFDELLSPDGVRSVYRKLHQVFQDIRPEDLSSRVSYLSSRYLDTGVTFDFAGQEEPFPLDIVPRLIQRAEFERTER